MKVVPLKDRVLVLPKQAEEKTKGGIYIPETAQEKKQEGTLIAVGSLSKDYHDVNVAKNDRVLYESYSGTEIVIDGKKHLILHVKDILAKIE